MSKSTNEREREKREAKLRELRVRPTEDGPRCLHCQMLLPVGSVDFLCAACDGD